MLDLSKCAYKKELLVAIKAVCKAAILTRKVSASDLPETVSKNDSSPVTVADLGAQAIIISGLRENFPSDKVVGEEDSSQLKSDSHLYNHVWDLIKSVEGNNLNKNTNQYVSKPMSKESVLDNLDYGSYKGGELGRMWTVDPVDGTKGFLRKGQYAICLALIVDSKVKVGVIGCPNLPLDNTNNKGNDDIVKGSLYFAVENYGSYMASLDLEKNIFETEEYKQIHFRKIGSTKDAIFCESVESGHSSHSNNEKIAKLLGITKESVRMDSQAKYCSISRGDADIYLRLPVSNTYEEKIWDHASGCLIVQEAGGIVTDMYGKPLDFGKGRTLKDNKGVIASSKSLHPSVIKAVQEVVC